MSDLLSIGASGVRAYQTALSTVGENIANVGTVGYARRSVTLSEVQGSGAVNAFGAGNGVTLSGVARATDVYSATALRASTADLTRTTKGAEWLDRIQDALTGNALSTRVTSFFASAQSLAAEPNSSALRTGMISAAGSAAIAFQATGQAFDQVDADLDSSGRQAASDLTSLGVSLGRVNEGLGRAQPGSTAAAQLMDQRDTILGQMSELVDIDARMDKLGRATVGIGGSSTPAFVQGVNSGTVTFVRNADRSIGFEMTVNGSVTDVTANGGSLAGLADGAQRTVAIRQVLESVAKDFVEGVNANQKGGTDQNGAAGSAMFSVGASATDISVVMTEGSQIAAAAAPVAATPTSPAKPAGGARDSSNLAALEKLRGSRGFEASLTTLVTGNATAYKQKNTIADAQAAIRDGAATAASAATGVNLDSEAVDLMRFQQAYAASSRVIQVARETMQSILDIR